MYENAVITNDDSNKGDQEKVKYHPPSCWFVKISLHISKFVNVFPVLVGLAKRIEDAQPSLYFLVNYSWVLKMYPVSAVDKLKGG